MVNLDILFDEVNIQDEDFKTELNNTYDFNDLEELEQDIASESIEKVIIKQIFRRAGISYSIKYYKPIIEKLKLELMINKLPHFKQFMRDLFKFADQNLIPKKIKDLLD